MNYTTVPALIPALFTPSTQVVVLDIDGDGNNEVIVLTPDIGQLAVIHQFTYAQLSVSSADWSDTTPHWWNQWTTPPRGMVPQGWVVQTGDTMVAGDFDGDGQDELFLYNTTTLAWGIVKWQVSTNGLSTIYSSTNGCTNWTPQTGDMFFLFPRPNGAATSGLLAFNTVTLTIGVLQYDTASQTMSCPTATPGGNIGGWQFHSNDQFHAGLFAGASAGAFLLFNPDTYIARLAWDGTAFSVSGCQNGSVGTASGGTGAWEIHSDDSLLCMDLNGDGADEVFVYNSGDQYVGALTWIPAASQFQCLAATNSIQGWTIGDSDQYSPVRLSAGTGLVAYNSALAKTGVLQFTDSNEFQRGVVSHDLTGGDQWPVRQHDIYYSPPLVSQANPAQFVVSSQSPSPGADPVPTLGALSVSLEAISVFSQVALPAPGWTPTLLAQAPPTNVPWTQGEKAVYQFLSDLFSRTYGSTSNDIRSLYTNATLASDLGQFGGNLESMANPTGQNFSSEDWTNVTAVIAIECNAVNTISTDYYPVLQQAAENVRDWQTNDLNTAQLYIQGSLPAGYSQTPNPLVYWEPQFVVAALWGLAAITGDPLFGAIGSMVASLFGSVLGVSSANSGPLQSAYNAIAAAIAATYKNAWSIAVATAPAGLLSDPGKLRIFSELNATTWAIPDEPMQLAGAFEATDRRSIYAQLLPCVYSIAVIPNGSGNYKPFYFTGDGRDTPMINYFGGSNPDSYQVGGIDGTPYIYALYVNNGSFWHPFVPFEPSADLTNDLFVTLGIGKAELLAGMGMWSKIPRILFPGGYAPCSPSS